MIGSYGDLAQGKMFGLVFFCKKSLSAAKITISIVGFKTYPKNLGLFHLENEVFARSLLSFPPGCLLEA